MGRWEKQTGLLIFVAVDPIILESFVNLITEIFLCRFDGNAGVVIPLKYYKSCQMCLWVF